MILDKLTTTYGKVLLLMYDNKILLNGEYMVPLTQIEICEMLNSNKTTINHLFKEYEEDGLITTTKKRYYLTETAIDIAKKLKSIKR
jgi:predicted transcriptional regulator